MHAETIINKIPDGSINKTLSPKQLDAQNKIVLDGWVEFGSDAWREVDNDIEFTKLIIENILGPTEEHFLFLDTLGRCWGKGEDGYYPFHLESFGKKYGIRISKKATN